MVQIVSQPLKSQFFNQIHWITNYKRFDHWLWNAVKKKKTKRKIRFNCFFIKKKCWFQHNCSKLLWYGFKNEITAILIFSKNNILKYFFVSVIFSLLYNGWKNLIIISIFISFTIVIMTYDVYNSFKLALMVVECIGKKSSLLLMRLMMIFSISFAKNNCIFLKIFAFEILVKELLVHIWEKIHPYFKDLLEYLASKWLKFAASS